MAFNVISGKNAPNLDPELLKNYFLDSVEELVNKFDCADSSASDLL